MINFESKEKLQELVFSFKTEFGLPVVFLTLNGKGGERISLYPADNTNKQTVDIFTEISKLIKESVDAWDLLSNLKYGIELYTDETDTCLVFILHTPGGQRAHFRCLNEDMIFNFIDYVDG